MKVLVSGAGGMVGRAVTRVCKEAGDDVISYDHQMLDITVDQQVSAMLYAEQPQVVINCAAWTDVDACERDLDKAQRVNSLGPENLARAAKNVGAGFITISTDYVFDGSKDGFYTQMDTPNPESAYAKSKLEGEQRAQNAYRRSVIVRTGFIFGLAGRNFLSTIAERARRGERLQPIRDAWGTPTYARDLAGQLRALALLDLPGTYHVVNSGAGASYEEFTWTALEATGITDAKVEAISVDSLHRAAPRPRNSRLACLLSEAVGLPPLRNWRDAIKEFAFSLRQSELAALDKTVE